MKQSRELQNKQRIQSHSFAKREIRESELERTREIVHGGLVGPLEQSNLTGLQVLKGGRVLISPMKIAIASNP
jgi:hypothetical protein